MEILGYIGFAILCFLAIAWTIGVRVKLEYGIPNILGALSYIICAVALVALELNKLHSLWMIPAGFIIGIITPLLISIPVISMLLRMAANIFAGFVRIGIPPEKIKAAQDAAINDAIDEFFENQSKDDKL